MKRREDMVLTSTGVDLTDKGDTQKRLDALLNGHAHRELDSEMWRHGVEDCIRVLHDLPPAKECGECGRRL